MTVIEEIAAEDEMYAVLRNRVAERFDLDEETVDSRARANYLRQGRSALECIELALLAARKDEVGRILDFGCGHGRVLRMIKARFPEAELTACDVDRGAVEFCAETFGAHPVYSTHDLAGVDLEGVYDLIWCGSVFTHIDRHRWDGLLRMFEAALAPGGVLVFTTHGRKVAQLHARSGGAESDGLVDEFARAGFAYRDFPDVKDYGTSLSSPAWVCAWLERQSGLRLVLFTERGWDDFQDVVACIRPEDS